MGLIFIDLQKAYDRVDRHTLWHDLAVHLGVPDNLI